MGLRGSNLNGPLFFHPSGGGSAIRASALVPSYPIPRSIRLWVYIYACPPAPDYEEVTEVEAGVQIYVTPLGHMPESREEEDTPTGRVHERRKLDHAKLVLHPPPPPTEGMGFGGGEFIWRGPAVT